MYGPAPESKVSHWGRQLMFAKSCEHRAILSRNPRARHWGWRVMRLNPGVYVRGRIRPPDHNTITLQAWHRVVMNTEHFAVAMKHVAFLD